MKFSGLKCPKDLTIFQPAPTLFLPLLLPIFHLENVMVQTKLCPRSFKRNWFSTKTMHNLTREILRIFLNAHSLCSTNFFAHFRFWTIWMNIYYVLEVSPVLYDRAWIFGWWFDGKMFMKVPLLVFMICNNWAQIDYKPWWRSWIRLIVSALGYFLVIWE